MNVSLYTTYARCLKEFDSNVSAFRYFREKGIRYADILSSEFKAISFEEYLSRLTDAGMELGSYVDLSDTASFDRSARCANRKTVREYIDKLEKNNVSKIMLAPAVTQAKSIDDYKRMRELLIEGFADAVEYARGSGVTVMIENQSLSTRADSRVSDLLYILDSVPGLKFVFDTGNFFCVKEDAIKAYEKFRDRIVHVHVKDWTYDLFGTYLRPDLPRFEGTAIGEGLLPNREIIALLAKDGFKGNLTLEINSARTNFAMLDRSADFLIEEMGKYK